MIDFDSIWRTQDEIRTVVNLFYYAFTPIIVAYIGFLR